MGVADLVLAAALTVCVLGISVSAAWLTFAARISRSPLPARARHDDVPVATALLPELLGPSARQSGAGNGTAPVLSKATGNLSAPPLRLRLCGDVALTWHSPVGDTDITAAFSRRELDVIVALALHPAGARRDTLLSLVWPDSLAKKRSAALHSVRYRLQAALTAATSGAVTDVIVLGPPKDRLDPGVIAVDFWDFDAAVSARRCAADEDARLAARRRMLSAYGGDLAPGYCQDWIAQLREHVRTQVVAATIAVVKASGHDDPHHALGLLEQAHAASPHDEDIARGLMSFQHLTGESETVPLTMAAVAKQLTTLGAQPEQATVAHAVRLMGSPAAAVSYGIQP